MENQLCSVNSMHEEFKEEGLYLIFDDNTRINLTKKRVDEEYHSFWDDPTKISKSVRSAVDFQRCSICPLSKTGGMCDAIRPLLPLLEEVDRYMSFDRVTAVYKGKNKGIFHVANTVMQGALQYVSILCLMYYCCMGRKYWKYFLGIIPIMDGKEITNKLYLNIFWLSKGDKSTIIKTVTDLKDTILLSSQNQVKRLNLICKNDAFMNAFVNTHAITQMLAMDMEKILSSEFESFQ